jgi:hypothetical protein
MFGIESAWGTFMMADYASTSSGFLVQYKCVSNVFNFLSEGIDTDQINIYTRDGKAPSPTEMDSIKTVILEKMPNIDM